MMITNLPLLFVKGKSKSLANMSIADLETFIPFLVHCSWGHDTAKKIQQPAWWPKNVPFNIPIVRPKVLPCDWGKRLRALVTHCYKFHSSEFLLKFSDDLSRYPESALNFVHNCDNTISLYLKITDRLLVTFRNENISYDKKTAVANRKCLLPERQGNNNTYGSEIYLCDTCDDTFNNLADVKNHEKNCNRNVSTDSFPPLPPDISPPEPNYIKDNDQRGFLGCVGLQSATSTDRVPSVAEDKVVNENLLGEVRLRRNLTPNGLTNFPFSSPAGLRLAKDKFNGTVKQREPYERYCGTPLNKSDNVRWLTKHQHRQFPVRYKKTEDYWNRQQIFPGQRNKIILDLKSQLLFRNCQPCQIIMERITPEQIASYLTKPKIITEKNEDNKFSDNDIEFISCTTLPGTSRCEIIGKRKSVKTFIKAPGEPLAFIDLCSDDDNDQNENIYPLHPVASDLVSNSLVLATTPECLESLNSRTELEGAQYPVKECPSRRLPPSQNRLKPLQQCQDHVYSFQNNVIMLD